MYWLMGARLEHDQRQRRSIVFYGDDNESRLVSFLQELLYLCETEGLGFDEFAITMDGNHGRVEGRAESPSIHLGNPTPATDGEDMVNLPNGAGFKSACSAVAQAAFCSGAVVNRCIFPECTDLIDNGDAQFAGNLDCG